MQAAPIERDQSNVGATFINDNQFAGIEVLHLFSEGEIDLFVAFRGTHRLLFATSPHLVAVVLQKN
jgi:hypothetical protein